MLPQRNRLTVIIIVPVRLLDGVTVWDWVGGRGRGEIGCYATNSHGLAVSVHRVWVEGAELRMLRDGRALKWIPVQVVSRVAWNAGSVGDGPHRDLRRDVGIDVLVEFGVKVRSLEKGVRHVWTAELFVVIVLWPAAAGPLADDDEEEDHDEDARDKDHNANHLLQADVPGGGDKLVADLGVEFAHLPAETQRAVTLVGAVRVLALASVTTGVLDALIDIAQAPEQIYWILMVGEGEMLHVINCWCKKSDI